ncbi:Dipeptidyl aminopeptidase 4 [Nymphon striatum]|nr:Dipeptidyl aminopeptidase 4 [Nymphon striatum]
MSGCPSFVTFGGIAVGGQPIAGGLSVCLLLISHGDKLPCPAGGYMSEAEAKETYGFDDDPETFAREHLRLRMLSEARDPSTFRYLDRVGIAEGMHCLEIGAGAGTVSAWMADKVGPTGKVLSTDVDLRFHGDAPDNVMVREHNIVTDTLKSEHFDVIHARAVFQHIPSGAKPSARCAGRVAQLQDVGQPAQSVPDGRNHNGCGRRQRQRTAAHQHGSARPHQDAQDRQSGFTPRRVADLTDKIQDTVDRLIDNVADRDGCDLVTDIAVELPLQVIADLVGVPEEDRHQIFHWTEESFGFDPSVTAEQRSAATASMYGYADQMCELRRQNPDNYDDLISVLMEGEVEGEKLTQFQIDLFFLLLQNAGSETTRNLITTGVVHMLENPDQLHVAALGHGQSHCARHRRTSAFGEPRHGVHPHRAPRHRGRRASREGGTTGGALTFRPKELARRERAREAGGGIVSYATDGAVSGAVYALGGRLFTTDLETGETAGLPAVDGVFDPRPDPTGERVAYVAGGNLHVTSLDDGDVQLCHDADPNVTWGAAEFIAAEEMGRSRGYWWAPTGQQLLVSRVDSTPVTRWHLSEPTEPAQDSRAIAYPAAGTANARVELFLVNLSGERVQVKWNADGEWEYLADAAWSPDSVPLLVVQSRDQRTVAVLEVAVASGDVTERYRWSDSAWVELVSGVPAVVDGRLLTVEDRDDTRMLVMDGQPLSPAGLQIRSVLHTTTEAILVSATTESTELHVYRISTGGDVQQLTTEPGIHSAVVGGDVTLISSATMNHPGSIPRVLRAGEVVAQIASNAETPVLTPSVAFHSLGLRELRTAVVLPEGADRDTPLPVLLDPYGGPHALRVQKARGAFGASQWFANQGFAVVVTDGRGTPARGPVWEREVRGDLAAPVLDDQVEALEAAAALYPGMDLDRVGIRGWSFGGYLAALAVIRRPDRFHAAVAGAPVTDWRLYDTHYTERYLGHPETEPDNYNRTNLVNEAADLTRPLMLIHGLADDNVPYDATRSRCREPADAADALPQNLTRHANVSSSVQPEVRLVATDLDGTLLRSDETISDRTFEVFAQAQAAGVTVVAATGRGPMALPAFAQPGIIEMAVCSNGAAVVDLMTGAIVERNDLAGRSVEAVFAEVRSALPGSYFAWESAAGFGWDPSFAAHGQILIDSYAKSNSIPLDPSVPVSKAFVAHDELGYDELSQQVKDIITVDAEVTSAGLPFVVVTAANVTKASTLNRLCTRKGIEAAEVVAFGDSWNDLDMLTWAGLGVAMANANDEVKDVADAVAGSHDDDGVANFLADLLSL